MTLFLFVEIASSQTENSVKQIAQKAVELMNAGQYDEALEKFEQALKLEPDNIYIAYQIGYIYYRQNKYDEAINILDPLQYRDDTIEQVFQLLGYCYDFSQRRTTALEVYTEGISKFPESVGLRIEAGIVENDLENYAFARRWWHGAITIAPEQPLAYYFMAKHHNIANNLLHSIYYSEVFLNLTRDEEKFREINALLYSNYEKYLNSINSDTERATLLDGRDYQLNKLTEKPLTQTAIFISIDSLYYEALKKLETKDASLANINFLRNAFIEKWISSNLNDNYPFDIFHFRTLVYESGHYEAYNYWLMSDGNIDEFTEWLKTNNIKFSNFMTWLGKEHLKLHEQSIVNF